MEENGALWGVLEIISVFFGKIISVFWQLENGGERFTTGKFFRPAKLAETSQRIRGSP